MMTPPLRIFFIVTALFASSGYALSAAFLGPVVRQVPKAAEAFTPTPIRPAPGDILTVGDNATVIWDASSVPDEAAAIPRIDLYRNTTVGLAEFIANLAEYIDPRLGMLGFAVPPVERGSYLVMMGGVDGPSSSIFAIEPRHTISRVATADEAVAGKAGGVGIATWDVSSSPQSRNAGQTLRLRRPQASGFCTATDPPLANFTQLKSSHGSLPDAYPLHPDGGYLTGVRFRAAAA